MSYKYVAVIGVDGMGAFNKECNTPEMDGIFENGATTYSALSIDPTISAQNWGAMLLGSDPMVHKLTNGIVSSQEYGNDALPSVFKYIRDARPDAYLASYVNWNPINYGIIEHNLGVDFYSCGKDGDLTEKIIECVAKKPEFLFVQFDDVDGAGHGGGYGSKRHLAQIEYSDKLIGRIYNAYSEAGILNDTLFIVTADHGGIRTGHGGYADTEKYIFIGASGKYVKPGEIGFAKTKDIAAIVLYAMGIEVPEYNESGFSGQVPFGIFPDYPNDYRRVYPAPHNVENKPTPEMSAANGLSAYTDASKLKLAMFFDYNLDDSTGKCSVEIINKPKFYSEGIRGANAELGNTGYAVVNGAEIKDSFSVCCWLKIDRINTEAIAVFGNKDWFWRNRRSHGFMLALRCNDVIFNLGTGDDDEDIVTPFPEEISEGWIHTAVTVNYQSHEIKIYYNFKYCQTVELPEKFFTDMSGLPLTVGNDGPGTHNNELYHMLFNIDDLLLYDGVLSETEISRLAEYYK